LPADTFAIHANIKITTVLTKVWNAIFISQDYQLCFDLWNIFSLTKTVRLCQTSGKNLSIICLCLFDLCPSHLDHKGKTMSNVQMLLSQKMALERMIEQARVAELERQRHIEAETLALRNAEIASARETMQSVMKKYGLTEEQILKGHESLLKLPSRNDDRAKKLTLQEMRTFYAKL
jgi:ribosomal protein L17